jgi:hypothetical protein
MTVTIPAPDWFSPQDGLLGKNVNPDPSDALGMIVIAGEDLYVDGDPCDWSTTQPARPSTTVDASVAAMSAQKSRDATKPVDVTVGGYSGKSITVHVPDDADFGQCDQATFGRWGVAVATDPTPMRYHQAPARSTSRGRSGSHSRPDQ